MLGGRPCSAAGRGDGDVVAVTREGNLAGRLRTFLRTQTLCHPSEGNMTDQPPTQQPPPAMNPVPGHPPYPPYPPYAYPAPFNTYAILALVFGAMVFPPLGIYFGSKAKGQIAQTGERGVELATAGVVVGWIFTALYGVVFLAWCGMAAVMLGSAPGVQP